MYVYDLNLPMFRALTDAEEEDFRMWASANPRAACEETREKENMLYHPIVRDEWDRMAERRAHALRPINLSGKNAK